MEDNEIDYVAAEDAKVLIAEGTYNSLCVAYSRGYYKQIPKLFLNFRLISNPYEEVKLFMSFNMPYDGRIQTGSRYYKAWVEVNGQRPSRGAKMSPRIFLNKVFKAKVKTVRPKEAGEESGPFDYSIIESLTLLSIDS